MKVNAKKCINNTILILPLVKKYVTSNNNDMEVLKSISLNIEIS